MPCFASANNTVVSFFLFILAHCICSCHLSLYILLFFFTIYYSFLLFFRLNAIVRSQYCGFFFLCSVFVSFVSVYEIIITKVKFVCVCFLCITVCQFYVHFCTISFLVWFLLLFYLLFNFFSLVSLSWFFSFGRFIFCSKILWRQYEKYCIRLFFFWFICTSIKRMGHMGW